MAFFKMKKSGVTIDMYARLGSVQGPESVATQ